MAIIILKNIKGFFGVRIYNRKMRIIIDLAVLAIITLFAVLILPAMLKTTKQIPPLIIIYIICYMLYIIIHITFMTLYYQRLINRAIHNRRQHSSTIYPREQPAIKKRYQIPEKIAWEDDDNDSEKCCICMASPISVTLYPCLHNTFCEECIRKLSDYRCPLCRSDFSLSTAEIMV